jgi:predicted ABC-type ATPase
MKTYTLIGGVNGVGKSSLSGVLSGESSDLGIIIDTDKITAELGGDKLAGGKLVTKGEAIWLEELKGSIL